MLKKFAAALGAAILSVSAFTSCGSAPKEDDGKLSIVCTVFSCYDWTREIIGDTENTDITYLLSNGTDIHSFQPTADDIIKISDCDVLVYVGGESDSWVDDALKNSKNKNMIVVDLMDVLAENIKPEEIKEGMEDTENDEGDAEYDEHIWLSLNNAQKCVSAITSALIEADPENSTIYSDNAAAYNSQLQLLDRSLHILFDTDPPTLIFGDRFPFRYFTEDYGLDYYAAFTGCSADTQASFDTITFLAQKADEVNAETIFAIENSDCTIADAVIANTKNSSQSVTVLDSIQSITDKQINEGASYLSIMEKNYDVLKEVYNP